MRGPLTHTHRCATKDCPHYYVCSQRDCRTDWTCPTCEDDEFFNDLQQMEQEQQTREMSRAENQ